MIFIFQLIAILAGVGDSEVGVSLQSGYNNKGEFLAYHTRD